MMIKRTGFDPVHDIQKAFRKTMRAFSFPGRVEDLGPETAGQDFGPRAPGALILVARMLLDAETGFYCRDDELAGTLELLTFAKRADAADADFLFVLDGETLPQALREAKAGSLVDPHEAALIVAVARIGEAEREWTLSGPGVDGERSCRFALADGWEEIRAERNREFPLGVDMLLLSAENAALALPRTTRVRAGGA